MEESRRTAAMCLGVENGKRLGRVTVVWLEAECLEQPDAGRWGTRTHTWSRLDATRPQHEWRESRLSVSATGSDVSRWLGHTEMKEPVKIESKREGIWHFKPPSFLFSPQLAVTAETQTSAPTARTELTLRSSFLPAEWKKALLNGR